VVMIAALSRRRSRVRVPSLPLVNLAPDQDKARHIALVLARTALELRSASAQEATQCDASGQFATRTVTRRGRAQALGDQAS